MSVQQAAALTPQSSVCGDDDVGGGEPSGGGGATSSSGGGGAERSTEVHALMFQLDSEQRERQRLERDREALEARLRNLTRLLLTDGRMLASGLQVRR